MSALSDLFADRVAYLMDELGLSEDEAQERANEEHYEDGDVE